MPSAQAAPVAVFAFRRPDHLRRCLDSLAANPLARESQVTVFVDGPRSHADADAVTATRAEAARARAFGGLEVIAREENAGLARSVIEGVTATLDRHDRAIVLEDDLLLSPDFLRYANEGLEAYADDPRVASIHGFTYATDAALPTTFFLRGADCWGWATWRRAWAAFEHDGQALLERLDASGDARAFDLDGAFPYRAMLERQACGELDSWAIRWHASAFLAGMLTLYPGRSLVVNEGQEGSGTNSVPQSSHAVELGTFGFPLLRIPAVEDADARSAIARSMAADRPRGPFRRLARRMAAR